MNIGLERFNRVALSTFAMGVVLIGGVAVAVLFEMPALPLLAYLVAALASLLLLVGAPVQVLRKRLATQTPVLGGDNARVVGAYCGPMFLATVLTNTGLWLAGRSLLGQEDGTQAFAEFALGLHWFGLADMASNVVAKAVMPRLARNVYLGDMADQRATLTIGVFLAFGGASVVLGVVVVFHPFILLLYGTELEGAKWALLLFVAAGVVGSPVSVIGNVLIAEGRYGAFLASTAMWWVAIVLGVTLTREYGSIAYFSSIVLSYAVFLASIVMVSFKAWPRNLHGVS